MRSQVYMGMDSYCYMAHVGLLPRVVQYECEDILGDAALFDALGVGLGRAEMMDVALAVKKLGEDPKKGIATVSRPTQADLCRGAAAWHSNTPVQPSAMLTSVNALS